MIFIKFKRERDQTCISFILTNQLPCCLEHPVEERETQISLQKKHIQKNIQKIHQSNLKQSLSMKITCIYINTFSLIKERIS